MGIGKRNRGREPEHTYKRDGVYYARITVDGRERRKSLKTRDREEAARRVELWLRSNSPYKGTIRHTFTEAALLWVAAGDWKPKTLAGYGKLLAVLEAHFGSFYWDQVDKAALMLFAEKMRQPRRGVPNGTSTATINRYYTVISGIADHVRDLPGWPEINPVKLLSAKSRKEKRLAYIRPPASDIEKIFDRMKGTFGDLCRFALVTGARMSEITSLLRADVHPDRAQLWNTKHHFRVISLNAEARDIVARQPQHKDPHLFVTGNGGPYKKVTEMWREVVLRAQIRAQKEGLRFVRMRFHDLRHEYAIRYLESGGNIYTLQKLLGHSTIGQTEGYLRYLTPEQATLAKDGAAQKASQ